MNVSKYLKVLCLVIICTLGTYNMFAMNLSGDDRATSGNKRKALHISDALAHKRAKTMPEEKEAIAYDLEAQELPDLYRLAISDEEKLDEEAWKMARAVNQKDAKDEKKEAKPARNIFRQLNRRQVYPKIRHDDQVDRQRLHEYIKALPSKNRFEVVMNFITIHHKSSDVMISDWTCYLTPEKVQDVVTKLEIKAEEFIGAHEATNHEELMYSFAQLPENFFKMVVRKTYHNIYSKLIDDVRISGICEDFRQSKITWTNFGIESLAIYSDLLAVSNDMCPLEELRLVRNRISKIEGLDKLTRLKSLWMNDNQITKIEGLDKLVNLGILSFSNNPIAQIEGLDNLANLELLNLVQTNIPPDDQAITLLRNRGVTVNLVSAMDVVFGAHHGIMDEVFADHTLEID